MLDYRRVHTFLICNIINSQLSILEAWTQRCVHASAEVVGHWPSACCPAPRWWMWQASLQFAELLAMVGSRKNAKKQHKLDEKYHYRWHLVTLPDFEKCPRCNESRINYRRTTLPETYIFAPENGWLEYSFPFGALPIFSVVLGSVPENPYYSTWQPQP